MPCYRCGTRQTDPDRGQSPWKRGVRGDTQVLVCPQCQTGRDWTSDLERCGVCGSVRLARRLGEVECRDCGQVRETAQPAAAEAGPTVRGGGPAADLAEEVARALDRVLGPHRVPR
jgi:hypothetical protein